MQHLRQFRQDDCTSVVDEPLELGRRLNWEALRGGLDRARHQLFLGDGAPWIWNLQQDRWRQATGLLDLFHASQHLWAAGRAHLGEEEKRLVPWVEKRLHQLRHGQEKQLLRALARLKKKSGAAGESLLRCHRSLQNQPVMVESKPATLR